ncbi:MAG: Regulatory LuxR family protein [Rhodospirillales bacterium]|nr:Regulatory LuxR family protein [Rhodospirillales bacterium]
MRIETSKTHQPSYDTLDGDVNLRSPARPRSAPDRSEFDILWRCRTRQNLTGASLSQIRRGLARARRLMLTLRTNEAIGAIDLVELQLDDVSPAVAERLRAAAQLLRAASLALQDDSLAAVAIAVPHLRENAAPHDNHVASTLCRLGFWQLREFDLFYSLPRHVPGVRGSRPWAISAVLDLSIEAAAALDDLRISTAKRLAADASAIAEAAKLPSGLAALPACLTAQVLYEEGNLDEADMILRDRLPAVNAEGSIECALRAYLVLTRIAKHRTHYNFAAILLREGELLGERRGWSRLVAACLAERASLLLEAGRTREAGFSVEYLERYTDAHRTGTGHALFEIMRYRALARWRLSWAEAPSREAVASLRQLYHHAVEKRDLYAACRLAVELADKLAAIGEADEADALFFQTLRSGAAAGLYQLFLEGQTGSGTLLRRAYEQAAVRGAIDGEVVPFVGSLLSAWDRRGAEHRPAQASGNIGDIMTARERDILGKISQGFPNKRIARALSISPETVKSHIKRIFLKLAVSTRSEAVSRAKSLGAL